MPMPTFSRVGGRVLLAVAAAGLFACSAATGVADSHRELSRSRRVVDRSKRRTRGGVRRAALGAACAAPHSERHAPRRTRSGVAAAPTRTTGRARGA